LYEFSFGKQKGLDKEEIRHISDFFLKLGVKYRFFMPQTLSTEEYLHNVLNLVDDAVSRKDEFRNGKTHRTFSISSYKATNQIRDLYMMVPLPNGERIEMIPLSIETGNNDEVIGFEIFLEFDPKACITLILISNSDIWWPDLLAVGFEGASRVGERIYVPFDSYLRDIHTFATDYEYRFGYEAPNEYCKREGVLLDGKIIYQEDIEEDRVVPPDKYREMSSELIEKLKEYNLL
jgi:hypothetical protein